MDITPTWFEGVVNHSITLVRTYSGALAHYLVPLELEHVGHSTSTIFVKIMVAKVDLTAGVQ